jgi:hypothetical protein
LFDKSGKQLTIKDAIDAILALGIPVYFMGGFLRDMIKNKPADDIDLRFGWQFLAQSSTNHTTCLQLCDGPSRYGEDR